MDVAKVVDRVVARFIGTKHERDIKKLMPVIAAINAREAEVQALSDEGLKTRFAELRAQVQEQLKDADPAEPAYKQQLQQALEPAIATLQDAVMSLTMVVNPLSSIAERIPLPGRRPSRNASSTRRSVGTISSAGTRSFSSTLSRSPSELPPT